MSEHIKQAFERARTRVGELQRAGACPTTIVELHTTDVDLIVTKVFEDALARTGREPSGVALIALGGYGRAELAPNSDLDLLLLYRGWDSKSVIELNRRVMYPLWDSHRELGDRIREPRDVMPGLDRIDEVCALLDARLLAGDRGLFNDMQTTVWRKLERSRATFFANLVQASAARHQRYGHAGQLLEPNIRDSAGGIRDIHTLGWASKLWPGGDGVPGLVASGNLSALDGELIAQAHEHLLRVRIALHLAGNRHQDQLYLADQDDIAAQLGYTPQEGRPAADRLMQELFLHAREVDWIVAAFWDRILHAKRRFRFRSAGSESVGDGCVLVNGHLEVIATTNVADDPAGWVRVLRRAMLRDVPIGRATLNRLREEVDAAESVAWSSEARDVFLDILSAGATGGRALVAMDGTGLLGALVPEWQPIRAFPQRDLYHRFTVDRHLFAAVEELADSRGVGSADVRDAWSQVDDPDALFVAALVHDIGKGRAGDHSSVGAALAKTIAKRMLLSDDQSSDVEFLVQHHLLLAETAMRRDLNEQRTIDEVAGNVSSRRRLAMLYLLTRADSLATGPEAWSSFRSSLVRELYGRVREFLAGAVAGPSSSSQALAALAEALSLTVEETAALVGPMPESWTTSFEPVAAKRQLDLLRTQLERGEVRTSVHHADEVDEFIVAAHDRPGLFSVVTGVLALRGIDVHDAEIYTRSDGVAVEVFRVLGSHGSIPDERWSALGPDIAAALSGDLDLDSALAKKSAQSRRRRGGARPHATPRIVIDNHASPTHTVVEVHTDDRFGLLRTITKALADSGCDLSLAKVATYGTQVVDVFYVRDTAMQKIDGADAIDNVDRLLRERLS